MKSPASGTVYRSDASATASPLSDEQQYIQHLKSQLRRAQSMAALGELTSTATHEFNNVLMTVINYARLGLRNHDDESRDKALNKILDAAERASKITGTILAQARNRSASFEPTDLAGLVTDTLVLLERELNKYRVAVTTEFAPDLVKVHASGNQIQRVLLNLLINARQAMADGGQLLIQLRNSAEHPEYVELVVRDSGVGIGGEHLPHIFDPFYSTKSGPDESGKGGTGLGLAACKEIIEAHQGKIRVESSAGVGTAFTIRLPKSQG
jgi:signal transduction histidine kinase